jgi:hypothetical protein
LYAVQLKLSFDKELLEAEEITVGSVWKDKDVFKDFSFDNEKGKIKITISLLGKDVGLSASGSLARIKFKGKDGAGIKSEESPWDAVLRLEHEHWKVSDSYAKSIPAVVEPSEVVIKVDDRGKLRVVIELEGREDVKGSPDYSCCEVKIEEKNLSAHTDKDGLVLFEGVRYGDYTVSVKCKLYLSAKTDSKGVKIEPIEETKLKVKLLPGDINNDSKINILDLILIASCFDETKEEHASEHPDKVFPDINKDDVIDIFDLVLAAKNFSKTSEDIKFTIEPSGSGHSGASAKQALTQVKVVKLKVCADGSVYLSNTKGLQGIQLRIKFNPYRCKIKDASKLYEGVQILQGDLFPKDRSFIAENKVDNEEGVIRFSIAALGKALEKDEGMLAKIEFSGKNPSFEVIDLKVSNALGRSIRSVISVESLLPNNTIAGQNFPNPFNPETWIPYQLHKSAKVVIKIYNLSGQLVRTLDLGVKQAGYYDTKETAAYWDGRNTEGKEVPSGIYFYQLFANGKVLTKKMVVLK